MGLSRFVSLFSASLFLLVHFSAFAQVSVLTGHNDISRSGANTQERLLTPASLLSGNFEKLVSVTLSTQDFQLITQPLYVPNVLIGGTVHNLLLITSAWDDVYALDADNGLLLWHATLLDAAHGAAPGAAAAASMQTACSTSASVIRIGINGTPVIDPSTGTIYLIGRNYESGATVDRIHALDITTGSERFGAPVTIQASVPGTGWGSDSSGNIHFDPLVSINRAGLLLLNGVVYAAFASFCEQEIPGWHGWVMGYNAATMQQTGVWNDTPDGSGSGIWMSSASLAAEIPDPVHHPFGRMFVALGNGDFDAVAPYMTYRNFGEDIVNVDLSNGIPTPQDSFTVQNEAFLNEHDGDLGSGGVLILPDSAGSEQHPHLLVESGKSGTIFLVDRDNMGGFNPTDNIVQEITGALGSGLYSNPAYWNGGVYFWASQDFLKAYSIANGTLSAKPTSQSGAVSAYPGGTPVISSNGAIDGIVWAITEGGEAILQAYDATNVANLLYSSNTDIARDAPGPRSKFSVATVANGKVYVAAEQLYIYGSMFTVTTPSATVPAAAGDASTVIAAVASPFGSSFSGPVSLNVAGLPNGVTASFSSAAVTLARAPYSGSSVVTLNVPKGIASGSYPFQLIGSSGSLQSSVALTLNVTGAAQIPADLPIITPGTGPYPAGQSVTITDLTPGSTVYFTTNGSTPTPNSTRYTAPFTISATTTVQAIATAPGYSQSPVASAVLTVEPPAATPVITPGTGNYTSPQTITITSSTPGATIYYSTNAVPPTTSAMLYRHPFVVLNHTKVEAIAVAPGYAQSAVNSATINLPPDAATPTFTPPAGTYTTPQMVTIQTTTPNSTLFYTTDGTTPLANVSTQYTGPVAVGVSETLRALATSTPALYSQSLVSASVYLIEQPAAAPVISPVSGSYPSAQTITITDATPGANINFTTNGSTPTVLSPRYAGPFPLTGPMTVQAVAIAAGYSLSPVSAASVLTIAPSATVAPNLSPSAEHP